MESKKKKKYGTGKEWEDLDWLREEWKYLAILYENLKKQTANLEQVTEINKIRL
ncbi:MAG: hypothetical protein ACTSV7_14475 [Candidatus Baldrarchaeia archaeon]